MAWRRLRAGLAAAWRGLVVVLAGGRWLGGRLVAGWRWMRGSPWDRDDVAELYGEQTNRGYGSGIGDMVNRQEAWDRMRRAERRERRQHRRGGG